MLVEVGGLGAGLVTAVGGSDPTPAWVAFAIVVLGVGIGVVMVVPARRHRPDPLPDEVHALERRGYLAVERIDDANGPDWVLHRRRLPDRNLTPREAQWYFAIFGTTLRATVTWSDVRPPSYEPVDEP